MLMWDGRILKACRHWKHFSGEQYTYTLSSLSYPCHVIILIFCFRELALVNIMLLAGLGIDVHALVKLLGVIFRLTVLPTLVEVVVISVMSVFILNMPWLWSILLG